jgi:hypothetical protein
MTHAPALTRETVHIGKLALIGRIEACARTIIATHVCPDTGRLLIDVKGNPTLPHWMEAYKASIAAHRVGGFNAETRLDVYGRYMDAHPGHFSKAYANAILCLVCEKERHYGYLAAGIQPYKTPLPGIDPLSV